MSSEPPAVRAAPIMAESSPGGHVYRLSPAGRRTALILLFGVAAIWVFALWTLVTQAQDGLSGPEWVTAILMLGILVVAPVVGWTLLEERMTTITTDATGLTYRSVGGIHLTYAWPEITGLAAIPAPPSRWARLFMDNPAPPGVPPPMEQSPAAGQQAVVTQHTHRHNASPTVTRDSSRPGISPADAEDADEEASEAGQRTIRVAVRPAPAARIANPALRALWQQAHGDTLPLPGELESREAVLATIRDHLARQEPSPPA